MNQSQAWQQERQDLAEHIKAGGEILMNGKPWLNQVDVFMQMADDSEKCEDPDEDNLLLAVRVCAFDETGAGVHLAKAKEAAIERLLDDNEDALRRQWLASERVTLGIMAGAVYGYRTCSLGWARDDKKTCAMLTGSVQYQFDLMRPTAIMLGRALAGTMGWKL